MACFYWKKVKLWKEKRLQKYVMFYWKYKVYFCSLIHMPRKQADSQWEWIMFYFRPKNNATFYVVHNQAVEFNSTIYHFGK